MIWTQTEIDLLIEVYPKKGAKPISIALGRSPGAVTQMASKQGLRYVHDRFKWTPDADRLVESAYPSRGAAWIAKELGLTERKVYDRAHVLGVQSKKQARPRLPVRVPTIPQQGDRSAMDVLRMRW
jgi:hypothetical protein